MLEPVERSKDLSKRKERDELVGITCVRELSCSGRNGKAEVSELITLPVTSARPLPLPSE